MTKNVGGIDRTLRILVGLGLIAAAATGTDGRSCPTSGGPQSPAWVMRIKADGTALRYNNPDPYLPDLLICRKEWARPVLAAFALALSNFVVVLDIPHVLSLDELAELVGGLEQTDA